LAQALLSPVSQRNSRYVETVISKPLRLEIWDKDSVGSQLKNLETAAL
jgi:hypothetical protein